MRALILRSLDSFHEFAVVLGRDMCICGQCHEGERREAVHVVPLHDVALAEVCRDQALHGPFGTAFALDLLRELDCGPFVLQTHAGGVVPVNVKLPRELVALCFVEVVDLVPCPDSFQALAGFSYELVHGFAEGDRRLVLLHKRREQAHEVQLGHFHAAHVITSLSPLQYAAL